MKSSVLKEEQFLTDAKGKRVGVVLALEAYDRLRQAEEDLADIQAYDSALANVRLEVRSGQFATLAAYRANRARKRR